MDFKETKEVAVSEYTAKLLEALKALVLVECNICDALSIRQRDLGANDQEAEDTTTTIWRRDFAPLATKYNSAILSLISGNIDDAVMNAATTESDKITI